MCLRWNRGTKGCPSITLVWPQRRYANASVLVATICVTAIIAIALLSYLQLSSHQQRVTARSQTWNLCLPMAEAGVEEALTHCYLNYGNLSSEGWSPNASKNVYSKTNSLPQGYYEVQFTDDTPHVITSRGYARLPGVTNSLARTLQVVYRRNVLFKKAINARGHVDLNGNNVRTDSFDSRDTTKSTGGRYDPAKAGDKGDVVCSNLVNVGNADIWGRVYTPPLATLSLGPKGAVGSLLFHLLNFLGLQPGWWITQTNFESLPILKVPFASGQTPTSGTLAGIYYDQIFDKGDYLVTSMSGNTLVQSNVIVYCTGSAFASLTILKGASLKLYVSGPICEITAITNANYYAGTCVFYGLPTCNDFKMPGGANLTCAIYSPDANITINGSAQVSGAVVCKDFTMAGSSQFHYDEALGHDPDLMIFELQAWDEL